jgi:hypothetical protein
MSLTIKDLKIMILELEDEIRKVPSDNPLFEGFLNRKSQEIIYLKERIKSLKNGEENNDSEEPSENIK